jgi:hypothetical protein
MTSIDCSNKTLLPGIPLCIPPVSGILSSMGRRLSAVPIQTSRLTSCDSGGELLCQARKLFISIQLVSVIFECATTILQDGEPEIGGSGSGIDGYMHKLRNLLGKDLRLIHRDKGARVG